MSRRNLLASTLSSGGGGITFPITLIEGDNGNIGKQFYEYVKNGKYTNSDTVYFDWRGFIFLHDDWLLATDANYIGSGSYEVMEAYDPQGSAGHDEIMLSKEGILTIY